MTTHDAEFTPHDRLMAVALQLHDDLTCSCGGWLPETTDPKNRGAYRADPPSRCHVCTELGRASERHKDAPHPHALRFRTRKVELRPRGPAKRVELTEEQKAAHALARERYRESQEKRKAGQRPSTT